MIFYCYVLFQPTLHIIVTNVECAPVSVLPDYYRPVTRFVSIFCECEWDGVDVT